MRQLTSFVLLLLFLYNTVGFYPAYAWRQQQFRREAEHQRRARLPDEALSRIRVARRASAALHWQDTNEFRWRGQLYDVVRRQVAADSITYFCWRDRGEERLLAGLHKHLDQLTHPGPAAGKTARKLFDHLFKLACLPGNFPAAPVAVQATAVRLRPAGAVALPGRAATIVVPPPEGPAATA